MGFKILVVEDDTHTQELIKHYFNSTTATVKVAEDGYAGLSELQTGHYDLLILDISLPHLNGFKILKTIRGNSVLRDLPVIMLTGSQQKSDVVQAKTMGVNEFIIKPPEREDLLKRVKSILEGGERGEGFLVKEASPRQGMLEVKFNIKKIQKTGIVVDAALSIDDDQILENLNFEIFLGLGLKKMKFAIGKKSKLPSGEFEYFLNYFLLDPADLKVIHEFIDRNRLKL